MEGRVLDLLVKISGTTERMVERVDQMRANQEQGAQRIEQLRDGQDRNVRKIERIQEDVTAIRTTLKRKGIVNGDGNSTGHGPQDVTQIAGGPTDASTDRVIGALIRQVAQRHGRKILLASAGLLALVVAGAVRFDVDTDKLSLVWHVIVR